MAVCEQVKNNLVEFLSSEGTLANVASKGLIKVPALLIKQYTFQSELYVILWHQV